MRPHRLTMTAFGPFAGTAEVDLDLLSSAGLFLLHGETGAGKTTLLDGLGFALFGRVPGERGRARRLRSDHSPPDVRTSVELEVTLANRRLRIARQPQQDKPAARGGGTTSLPARVRLDEWLDGQWRNVSTRAGEADAEICDLLGMSADQFFQVVLLPQGEFARFLRADSDERGKLLQRLFGTDRFRAVEDWLAERRRASAQQVEQTQQEVRLLSARVTQAAGPAAPDEPELLSIAWVAQVERWAQARGQEAERALAAARTALEAARRRVDQATQLADRQERCQQARGRQALVLAAEPGMQELRSELAASQRAGTVAPLLTQLDRRAGEAQRWREASRALPVLGDGSLATLVERERRALARLEALQGVADTLHEETVQGETAAADAELAVAAAADAATRLEALAGRRSALERDLALAQRAVRELPSARARQLVLLSAAGDAAALAIAHEACLLHRDEVTLGRESAVALQEKVVDIRSARVDSMIAELAATLADGSPCPVCGAVEHPDRSLLRGARVTRDDEDRVQTAYEVARQDVERAAVALAGAQATADTLTSRLIAAGLGGRSAVDLHEEAATQAVELDQLVEAAAQLTATEQILRELDDEEHGLRAGRRIAGAEQAAALRRHREAAARADHLRSRLLAELDGAENLASAMARIEALLATADQAVRIAAELSAAERELDDALHRATRAAETAGFDGTAEARSAGRDDAWQAASQELLGAHDAEVRSVQALLSDPALDVALEPAAPLTAVTAELTAAGAQHDRAAEVAATASAAARAVEALSPALAAAVLALEEQTAEADRVRALADLVNGTSSSNTLRMSLSAFVLAARLEEVALAATERLLRMTQGRYALVHTDAGRGGGRSGLGLLARDTWTGQDRATSTLSGGETFLASLALALGLADVVTAEAGGSRIEALFVDEGFGTLDEDALEDVMNVLDGLREGGRIVGVVSHVGELRQRIPAQVHVRKGRTGSELTVVGC